MIEIIITIYKSVKELPLLYIFRRIKQVEWFYGIIFLGWDSNIFIVISVKVGLLWSITKRISPTETPNRFPNQEMPNEVTYLFVTWPYMKTSA